MEMHKDNGEDPGIDLNDLPEFKKAYNKAVKSGKDTFLYKGITVVTNYALHVIEYLESLK